MGGRKEKKKKTSTDHKKKTPPYLESLNIITSACLEFFASMSVSLYFLHFALPFMVWRAFD